MGGSFSRLAWGTALLTAIVLVTISGSSALAAERRETRWYVSDLVLTYHASMDELGMDALERAKLSARAWGHVPGIPKVRIEQGSPLPMGYERDGENINGIYYTKNRGNRAGSALAITVVTFDVDDKEILDADILINGRHPFGNAGVLAGKRGSRSHTGVYDLQNVMTHEMGHVLGLGENPDFLEATMYPYSSLGEIGKRDVSPPDVDESRRLYSLNNKDSGCLAQVVGGQSPHGMGATVLWFGAGFGLLLARRRRLAATVGLLGLICVLGDSTHAPAPHFAHTTALHAGDAVLQETRLMDSVRARVASKTARWEDGFIVTRLELEVPECAGSHCGALEEPVEMWGGELEGIGQIVGTQSPPSVGEPVEIELRSANFGELARFVRLGAGRAIQASD